MIRMILATFMVIIALSLAALATISLKGELDLRDRGVPAYASVTDHRVDEDGRHEVRYEFTVRGENYSYSDVTRRKNLWVPVEGDGSAVVHILYLSDNPWVNRPFETETDLVGQYRMILIVALATFVVFAVYGASGYRKYRLRRALTAVPTNEDLADSAVPANGDLPDLAVPTNGDLPDLAVPTNEDLPDLAVPANGDLPDLAVPSAAPQPAPSSPDVAETPSTTDRVHSASDNMGTFYDSEARGKVFWNTRLVQGLDSPFVVYYFDDLPTARQALLDLPCINETEQGDLISTEVLDFGCYQKQSDEVAVFLSGHDLSHSLWEAAHAAFAGRGGFRVSEEEPAPSADTSEEAAVGVVEEVVFVQETRNIDGMGFEVVKRKYTAPTAASAKAFLQEHPVDQQLFYLEIDTPEGSYGRDIQGIYTY